MIMRVKGVYAADAGVHVYVSGAGLAQRCIAAAAAHDLPAFVLLFGRIPITYLLRDTLKPKVQPISTSQGRL